MPQRHALHRQLVLGTHELGRRSAHLVVDRTELLVERLHDTRGDVSLPVEVRDFLGQVVHVALQLAHVLLERLALLAELIEVLTLRAQPRLGALLRASRTCEREEEQRASERDDQTPRRCLPTETALPNSPISPPHTTPSAAMLGSKNVVCTRYRSMATSAPHVRSSASPPPNSPLIRPSSRKGRRTKPFVAPTNRMIEISRARASTASRMVEPMMITLTAAKAMPRMSPAAPAMLRML